MMYLSLVERACSAVRYLSYLTRPAERKMLRITPATPPYVAANVRLCSHCRHARRMAMPYKEEIGCGLYRNVDVVTGRTTFDDALYVRQDEMACGIAGKLFEHLRWEDRLSSDHKDRSRGSSRVENDGGGCNATDDDESCVLTPPPSLPYPPSSSSSS